MDELEGIETRWRLLGYRDGAAHGRMDYHQEADQAREPGTAYYDVYSPAHIEKRERLQRTAEKRAAKITASVPAEHRTQAREVYQAGYVRAWYEVMYL